MCTIVFLNGMEQITIYICNTELRCSIPLKRHSFDKNELEKRDLTIIEFCGMVRMD